MVYSDRRPRGRYASTVTAKEKLLREILDLDEAEAARARIIVSAGPVEEPEMAPLPAGWGETLTGEPMPNVAAAVRRSRESH
jgi:hypothetical protein